MHRRDLLRLLVLAAAWRCPVATAAQALAELPADLPRTLHFGVVPYLSTRRLSELHQPLRHFYEQVLARPVIFETTSGYRAFLDKIRAGDFDLVVVPPHFARIAQREHGYLPLACARAPLEPLIVVPRASAIHGVADLREHVMTTTDPLANLTLIASRYLRERGLTPGVDVHIVAAGTHINAVNRLLSGESVAAVSSRTMLAQVPRQLTDQVRVLVELPTVFSSTFYMAHPRLRDIAPALSMALLNFANDDADGRAFVALMGHSGMAPVRAADLARLDPYVTEFYRLSS